MYGQIYLQGVDLIGRRLGQRRAVKRGREDIKRWNTALGRFELIQRAEIRDCNISIFNQTQTQKDRSRSEWNGSGLKSDTKRGKIAGNRKQFRALFRQVLASFKAGFPAAVEQRESKKGNGVVTGAALPV